MTLRRRNKRGIFEVFRVRQVLDRWKFPSLEIDRRFQPCPKAKKKVLEPGLFAPPASTFNKSCQTASGGAAMPWAIAASCRWCKKGFG